MTKIKRFFQNKRDKDSLVKRIVLVIFAFVIMFCASSFMGNYTIKTRLSEQARAVVSQAMLNLEADFNGPMTAVNVAAETVRGMLLRGAGAEEIRAYLFEVSAALQEQKFGLELGRLYGYFDGGLFFDPLSGEPGAAFDPAVEPWYTDAVDAGGDLVVTQVFTDARRGGEVISCARRIFDDAGKPLGVVALDIPFEQLREHVTALRITSGANGSYGFLMNGKLEIIAHPDPALTGVNMHDSPVQSPDYAALMNRLDNELQPGGPLIEYDMEDYRGRQMIACSAKLSNGWVLTLVTPQIEYFIDLIIMVGVLYLLGAVLASTLIYMLVSLHKRTVERDAQLGKLATVTQNYRGVVWSADDKNVLTALRGQHLEKLGLLEPAFFEGKPLTAIQPFFKMDFTGYAAKTRAEGPQDWMFETDGITYHSYMTLLHDDQGRESGIVGSIDDVTEQACLQQKLEEALQEAEIANTAKSSFLANMSHEIRTPMNAILGITEILVQHEDLPSEIVEGLSKIHNSCGLLLGIINDILDFSKIEAGKLDITPAAYETASMVNDSMQLNMMRIGSKPIEFLLEIDENIPAKLVGDELRIKQILNNLLSNAFKYTDTGAVTLRVGFETAEDNRVKLILGVQDTGHGMTKAQVDKLFDEYTRFQTETNRVIEGTGLGMAITQRLVYLMGGEISIESELGKGSLFVVSLWQETVDGEVLGAELAENLRSFKLSLLSGRESARILRDPMPYGRVLVVDDVETNIYVAVGLLKLYGLQIDTAMSGAEAIDKTASGKVYDIVFMDHMMPVMDGIETVKRMRAGGYKEPIVALTANAVAKQADQFLQNGFDGFIAKPIDIRQLNAVLNRLVRDKQPPEVVEEARRQKLASPASGNDEKAEADAMLFASFVRDARKAVPILEEWRKDDGAGSEERLRQFVITVHGMKSALANIREDALSATAKKLEFAGKEKDFERIRQMEPDFLQKLRALIEKLEPAESGEDADVPGLIEGLEAVRAMCGEYDRKGATDILSELGQKNCPRALRETLDQITEAVLHSEFEEAAELAAQCAAGLQAGSQEKKEEIGGLDIGRGLDKFDGDRETYYKILRSYASSLNRMLEEIEVQSLSADALSGYEITVHGVKGASRDIFAEELGQSAAALEDAAKAGKLDVILAKHPGFADEARRLAGDILDMLRGIEESTPKPKKAAPDEDALAKLHAACEIYDMDAADAAMAEIEAYEYEADGGLAKWLREKVDITDFAAVAERLTEETGNAGTEG